MKTIYYVPPVLAVAIVAAWLTYLRGSSSALSQENTLLREKITNSRDASLAQNERASSKKPQKPTETESKPVADWVATSRDWKKLALFAKDAETPEERSAALSRLKNLLSEMNGEELATAYADIATLGLKTSYRDGLEDFMLYEIAKKNPEFAFSQYLAKFERHGAVPNSFDFKKFEDWVTRDPTAATAWYEKEIAAGTFDKSLDGKSPFRAPFEAAFIKTLLISDPAAAEKRLTETPLDQRKAIVAAIINVEEKDQKAFADMVRRTLPQEDASEMILRKTMDHGYLDDPKKIHQNFERIAATPEERSAFLVLEAEYSIVCQFALSKPSRKILDEFHTWAKAVDPTSADRVAGIGMAEYLDNITDPKAQEYVENLAIEYHSSGVSDEFLIPLIEGSGKGRNSLSKEKARELAMKITDENRREELLQKLK